MISDVVSAAPVESPKLESVAPRFAAEGYLGVGSQYVYRGVALRNSGPVVTAGATVNARGWFIDGWVGRVDTGNYYYDREIYREWLLDINAGYSAALNNNWQWSLSHASIAGIDSHLPQSRNYQEWRGNLFYRESIAVQVAYAENYRQLGWSSWNIEVGDVQPLTGFINGEIGVGRSHGAGTARNFYNYGWLGLQGVVLNTDWNLRCFHSSSGAEWELDRDRAGTRVELSLSWRLPMTR